MKRATKSTRGPSTRLLPVAASVLAAVAPLGASAIKRVKANANPPQYAAFNKLLNRDDRVHHALERLTFGPRPGDFEAVERSGLEKWIEGELHPERVPEDSVLKQRLAAFQPVAMDDDDPMQAKVIADDLARAKILRAIYSSDQFDELLVDFWFNHFNVNVNKGRDRYLVQAYEQQAIRPHVFGKFYDLLLATAQSPAMLFYLDNWQSVAPNGALAMQKKRRGLNENYGRELLELHTLGVDGGYTQQDVIEVARCFTGWTMGDRRAGFAFKYNDKLHDHGQKVVLGHVIPAGGGMDDGLEVLNILAHHAATAHFISLQLARRFVADDPPPSVVNRMAETFRRTDGDLRQVIGTMLASGEFWSEGAYRAKVKTPLEIVVSAVRATNAQVESVDPLVKEVQRLGEPLYRKVEPTGYSTASADWVSSAALLERMNFAVALAENRLPGIAVTGGDWQQLGAPEFQRH